MTFLRRYGFGALGETPGELSLELSELPLILSVNR